MERSPIDIASRLEGRRRMVTRLFGGGSVYLMRRVSAFLSVAGLSVIVNACALTDSLATTCDAVFIFGVAVTVEDSASGQSTASGAQLIVRSGSYADSMSIPADRPDLDAAPLLGAGERTGVFILTVRKSGFHDWVRSGVRVAGDECHPRTTELVAKLQRKPDA
jgi:hypothetical protein